MSDFGQEEKLKESLRKLEQTADEIVKTNGYTHEVKKIRLIAEMIKEQMTNEHIGSAARPIR